MNFFVDFDNTLFCTPAFSEEMLKKLSVFITKTCNIEENKIFEEISCKFGRGINKIFDIYELIKYFSEKYNYNEKEAVNEVNKVILNCEKYLYDDSIDFLKFLKEQGHKIYILSYNETKVYYQTVKIAGSSLLEYVDSLMTTTVLKGEMPLEFSKSIFIDDKPEDLISIYKQNPFKVYRINRPNSKFEGAKIKENILEFKNLKELTIEIKNGLTNY